MKLIQAVIIFLLIPLFSSAQAVKNKSPVIKTITEWLPNNFAHSKNGLVRTSGNPKTLASKYGDALQFNGLSDGLFLDQMPLNSLKEFTIEVLFRPESGGNFEQRLLHFGEIKGDRVLLEIRSTGKDWYFDAFINSKEEKKTLIDSTLLHPLNQWYHLAYVVDHGLLITYVNGVKELESRINLTPLLTGKTSIGVRQNEQSWFKGAIYNIKITPKALNTKYFTTIISNTYEN
jgi:hypothetical protein